MSCEDIREDLQACIDRELTPQRRAEVAAHLAACPGCRRRDSLLRAVLAALPPPAPVSPDFTRQVMARVSPAHQASQASPWESLLGQRPWARAAAFACAAAIMAAGALLTTRHARQAAWSDLALDRCLVARCGP